MVTSNTTCTRTNRKEKYRVQLVMQQRQARMQDHLDMHQLRAMNMIIQTKRGWSIAGSTKVVRNTAKMMFLCISTRIFYTTGMSLGTFFLFFCRPKYQGMQ